MKKSVAMKWVKALKSGKFKQGQSKLQRDNKFCCLGVLCKIAPKEVTLNTTGKTGKLKGFTLFDQENVLKWSGMQSALGVISYCVPSLAEHNDKEVPFKLIAALIKKYWRKL
jgi:hypothetical protein